MYKEILKFARLLRNGVYVCYDSLCHLHILYLIFWITFASISGFNHADKGKKTASAFQSILDALVSNDHNYQFQNELEEDSTGFLKNHTLLKKDQTEVR